MRAHLQIEALVSTVQFSTALIMALLMLLVINAPTPKKDTHKQYNKSRIYLLIGLTFLTIHFWLQWFTGYRITNKPLSVMINLSFLYPAIIVEGMSSTVLLRGSSKKSEIIISISTWIVQMILIWGAWIFMKEHITAAQLTSSTILLIGTAYSDSKYITEYRKIINNINNYYGYDAEKVIHWTIIGQIGITFLGLMVPVIIFMNNEVIAFTLIVAAILICHYVIRFIFFGIDIQIISDSYNISDNTVSEQTESPIIQNTQLSHNTSDEISESSIKQIEEKLDEWITEKKYLDKNANIALLALETGFNRNKLSLYFNRTLKKSYREWLNGIRLDEAKGNILRYDQYTMDTIAEISGFSSRTYFYKVFTEYEGMTPVQWKEMQS